MISAAAVVFIAALLGYLADEVRMLRQRRRRREGRLRTRSGERDASRDGARDGALL